MVTYSGSYGHGNKEAVVQCPFFGGGSILNQKWLIDNVGDFNPVRLSALKIGHRLIFVAGNQFICQKHEFSLQSLQMRIKKKKQDINFSLVANKTTINPLLHIT